MDAETSETTSDTTETEEEGDTTLPPLTWNTDPDIVQNYGFGVIDSIWFAVEGGYHITHTTSYTENQYEAVNESTGSLGRFNSFEEAKQSIENDRNS